MMSDAGSAGTSLWARVTRRSTCTRGPRSLPGRLSGSPASEVLAQRDIPADVTVHHWHPVAEEWENPDVAMPRTEAERQAEHQRLEDAETAESLATGIAQWEARAEFPSHQEAAAIAEVRDLLRRWAHVPPGGTLRLSWPLASQHAPPANNTAGT
jgi:hypothetical protein